MTTGSILTPISTERGVRIVQVTPVYPPYPGGIGQVAFEYTERLRGRGWDVHVTTPAYRSLKRQVDPPYVHRMAPVFEWGNAALVPRLAKLFSDYDLVHLHYPFFGGAEFVAFEKWVGKRTPLVVSYHMDVVSHGVKGLVFAAHRRMLMPSILRRADIILVSSLDYAKQSDIRLLADDPRVVEIPFGVDVARFSPGRASEIRRRHGIDEAIPLVLFVGGLDNAHAFKGFPVLLEALEAIAGYPWEALIVGDGDLRESFETMTRVSQVSKRVHFAGRVLAQELPEYYRAANVHVFPSVDRSEAFGLVVLEAAASGVPSIVSDLPGVRTNVLHEQTGLIVPPGQVPPLAGALKELLSNLSITEQLGAQARRRIEQEYTWDMMVDRLEDVYRRLVKRLM